MGIFKTKKGVKIAAPPEEDESENEIKHIENLSESKEEASLPVDKKTPKLPTPEMEYREVPVCLSQAQINNMIIENNIMLKQIMAEI